MVIYVGTTVNVLPTNTILLIASKVVSKNMKYLFDLFRLKDTQKAVRLIKYIRYNSEIKSKKLSSSNYE